jgi:hypothetical protein
MFFFPIVPRKTSNWIYETCLFWARSQNCEKRLLNWSCLSVRTEQLGSHWKDFHEIWCLCIFRKSVSKLQAPLNADRYNGYCTWRPIYEHGCTNTPRCYVVRMLPIFFFYDNINLVLVTRCIVRLRSYSFRRNSLQPSSWQQMSKPSHEFVLNYVFVLFSHIHCLYL